MGMTTNTTAKPLSPYQFRQVYFSLQACGTESALRQVAAHRAAGDFTDGDCDRMAALLADGYRIADPAVENC